MPLSETSLYGRVAAEIDAAGTAWVVGLSVDALRPLLASGTRIESPDGSAPEGDVTLVVVAARAVAESGAITPALPPAAWPSTALLGRGSRLVAVVLPTTDDDVPGAATARALVTELSAERAVASTVDRVLTVDAVLDRDEAGFVICELERGLSARQLQEQVTPNLRIRSTLTELSGARREERR
jgi:hypothetical protein